MLTVDLLNSLTIPPNGRNYRISSNEQPNWKDGNFDMTPLSPGQRFDFPVLDGPGYINHIWLTTHAGGVNELNALSLRIYWDDQEVPGVEVPLGDFFAVGQKPTIVDSFPVQVSQSGSLTCYWRMPFAKSARIVITNDNYNRSTGLYWQVDWVKLDSLPKDTMYFYARYRQEYPAVMGQDYLIADIKGCGKYVGTVLSVTLSQDGWFGEGDDFFYIDGEEVPSLQGTGTEDYFNDAWGFRSRTSLWFGQPHWQGYRAGDFGICYRWHVLDPVQFKKSLKVTIEHKGNRSNAEEAWYIERPDFLSSIAYWYQLGEFEPFGHLPPYPDRCAPWLECHLVEAFRQAKVEGDCSLSVQTTGFFGARPTLLWQTTQPGSSLTLPFSVPEDGRYAIRLIAFLSPSGALCSIQIDGFTIVHEFSFHSQSFEESDLLLGTHSLSSGVHEITFRSLTNWDFQSLNIERLKLLRLPPEVNREVKTNNEAHFIRLAIGRAVYAFRLAYGQLPNSLMDLVNTGILDARYLADENGYSLLSSREGDRFVVQSTAPNGWRHSWQGLDARR